MSHLSLQRPEQTADAIIALINSRAQSPSRDELVEVLARTAPTPVYSDPKQKPVCPRCGPLSEMSKRSWMWIRTTATRTVFKQPIGGRVRSRTPHGPNHRAH